jgi:hypothetical protein
MHIAQFFHPLALAPYIEVIEAVLPYMLFFFWKQLLLLARSTSLPLPQLSSNKSLFNRLHHPGSYLFSGSLMSDGCVRA